MKFTVKSLLTMVPALAVSFGGCGFLEDHATAEKSESKSFTTQATPHVSVDTFNGKIDVTAGTSKGVEVDVTKHARAPSQDDAEAALEKIEVTVKQDGDSFHIQAHDTDEAAPGSRGVDVTIQVPAGSVLDLKTTNGKMNVVGLTGDVAAETSNGGIQIKGAKGKLRLETTNGPIRVTGGVGKLEAKTSNGKIEIDHTRAPVTVQTSNGSIHFTGSLARGDNSFQSTNGSIVLKLSGRNQFLLDAETNNGSINLGFPLTQSEENSKTHVKGRLGKDDSVGRLKIETSNGKIEIVRVKERSAGG
jgi:DUF4097 and DUF4098 domain-containing protein YvlB